MDIRLRLFRNAIIAYGMMGIVNYLGVRNQVANPLDIDPIMYLFLWPLSRIERLSMVNTDFTFIGITILQIVILSIYFISSFLIFMFEAGRKAEKEAKKFLLQDEFRTLVDNYLYQKRDVIEQYPKLSSRNFPRLMDELILRDLFKLHEVLVYRGFKISRLGLQRAMKIQSRPIYNMMLEELSVIEEKHLQGDFMGQEISAEELEKLK